MRRRVLGVGLFALAVFLALPAVALADTALTAPTQVLPWQQLWPIVIGGVVPLSTYVINRAGPWISQPIKAGVLVGVSAAAAAAYTALATNVFGFNAETLQLMLTSVGSSLFAHHALWKPSGISTVLGAYGDYGLPNRDGKLGPPVPLPTRVPHPDGPLPAPAPGGSEPPPAPPGPPAGPVT